MWCCKASCSWIFAALLQCSCRTRAHILLAELPFHSALQGNRCISIMHTYIITSHPAGQTEFSSSIKLCSPWQPGKEVQVESRNPIYVLKGKSGTTVGNWNSSEARDWAEILRAIQTLQQKLNTLTLYPHHTYTGWWAARTLVMWQLVSLLSLPKADDFMSEYTLISVKENIQKCQTLFKSISDHNVARWG